MKTNLRHELHNINSILEDHLKQREMDRAFGYEPPLLEEEQEYLHKLCDRKHEIERLMGEKYD